MTDSQLSKGDSPEFANLQADEFYPLVNSSLDSYKQIIQQIKNYTTPSWQASIQPLEEAQEKFVRIWNVLSHLNAVTNTNDVRRVYEDLLPIITAFHTDLMQDQELYNIYKQIKQSAEFAQLNQAQQTIIEHELRDFELSGVHLPVEQRAEYKKLAEKLSELENLFSNNSLDASEGWSYYVAPEQQHLLAGIPQHAIDIARNIAQSQSKPGWVFTLDQPCYFAILSYAQNSELRKEFYIAYNTKASDQGPNAGKWDNTQILNDIMVLRQKMAQMVGFKNFAEYSLVPKMAKDLEQVNNFLLDLVKLARPVAKRELAALTEFAKQNGLQGEMQIWDTTYYAQLYKLKNYNLSEEELRQYFPEPRVLTGLFKLVRQIFGLEISEVGSFTRWHDSVRLFKVVDADNNLRGHFYIDLYTREGKRGGAWVAEYLSRIKHSNDFLQKPVAFLNCNFAPPTNNKPGLLTHDDVITLFHEFGHTLHHVLTQVDYYSVSGMNGVSWDAVELPSQFMENWCWQWQVLQDVSENVNTGEPISQQIFANLLASKNYNSAMALIRQLEFSIFDLRIHQTMPENGKIDAQKIIQQVRAEVSVLPIPSFNRFQNSFCHIFGGGYAAGYYSYLWAEVLSCDAFDKFADSGVFNYELGQKFMTTILEQGGAKPAMDLFVSFVGREPKVDALLKHHGIK